MSTGGLPTMIPIPSNIETITAPLILGVLLSTYMFGLLTVQFYIYCTTFRNDSRYIAALAYGVFVLETASCAMTMYDTYGWFASGYGNMAALNELFLSAFDTPMMEGMAGAALQGLYCYRIYTLHKDWKGIAIVSFIILLILTEVTAGIYVAISTKVNGETILSAAAHDFSAQYVLWVSAAVADIVIAVTMIIILLRRRSGDHSRSAPYQRSDIIITKIIKLIVETNMISSLLAVFIVCIHAGFPDQNWFVCPALVLGRVYSNSLFLMLNNRQYLRTMNQSGSSSGSQPLSRLRPGAFIPENNMPKDNVRIELETVVHSDLNITKSRMRESSTSV